MSRFAALALILVVLAYGCSQTEAPTDPASLALDHLRTHDYDEAIRSATEAIQQSPGSAAAYLYRGRAYYNRGGMGDAQRAIEDLGAAIRLSPDTSEGYYYRALVYRELGQTDLAEKDDARARELDHTVQEIFDQLPDSSSPSTLTKLKPIDPSNLKSKSPPSKTSAEMLRESASAESKSKSRPIPTNALGDSMSDGVDADIPAPVESALNKQYRALLGQSIPGEGTSGSAGGSTKDAFGRPVDRSDSAGGPDSLGQTASPLPSTENDSVEPLAPGAATWGRTQVAPMQSPFSQRAPTTNLTPGMPPTTQSPFPQAPRGATGYVPPVSPFGGPGGQASGATGISRPFSAPTTTTVRPQNNAVRPLFPRDYNP